MNTCFEKNLGVLSLVSLLLYVYGYYARRINIFSLVVIVQVSHRYFLVATHSRAISKSPIWGWRRGLGSWEIHHIMCMLAQMLLPLD